MSFEEVLDVAARSDTVIYTIGPGDRASSRTRQGYYAPKK